MEGVTHPEIVPYRKEGCLEPLGKTPSLLTSFESVHGKADRGFSSPLAGCASRALHVCVARDEFHPGFIHPLSHTTPSVFFFCLSTACTLLSFGFRVAAMPVPSFLCFLLVLLCNFSPSFATGLMTGAWDAPSRYVGLRYECPGVYSPRPFALTLRDLADDLSAFGWVQVSSNGTGVVVGEFRGTHSTAPVFEAALQAGPPGVGVPCLTLHYPSTLIRFHFADFKILADARETCFDAPPHQCPTAGGDTTDTPSNTPPNSSEGAGRGEGEGEDSSGGTEEVVQVVVGQQQ